MRVVSLFAGCGGLSLGFKQSNYDICASIEIENAFCKTLQANADKKELILNFDITEEDKYIDKLRHHIEKKIDGVIGGPPCQAYSIAGRINKNNKIIKIPLHSRISKLQEYKPEFKNMWIPLTTTRVTLTRNSSKTYNNCNLN